MYHMAALGNALDVCKRDAALLRALEDEVDLSSSSDVAPHAAEWRCRVGGEGSRSGGGWWPKYHGAACACVVAQLVALLGQLPDGC
jgi:hypothetical protein